MTTIPNGAAPVGNADGDVGSSVSFPPSTANAATLFEPSSTSQSVWPSGESRASKAPLPVNGVLPSSVNVPSGAIAYLEMLAVVEALDVIEDGRAEIGLVAAGAAVDQVALQDLEERFTDGVVVGASAATHRLFDAGLAATTAEGERDVLGIDYTQTLDDHGVLASVGSVGDAYDNALAESFVEGFKTKLITDRVWRSRSQLELAIVEYLSWFNNARLHESLGDIPPTENEEQHTEQEATTLAGATV